MRRPAAALLAVLVVLGIMSPAGGQTGTDDGSDDVDVEWPDGEWTGRLQSLNTTPTGMALTVIEFTLVTEDGAGEEGEITNYVARTEGRSVDEFGSAFAQSEVVDHDVELDEGDLPPTFSGDVTWHGRVISDSRGGESEMDLPEEVLPVSWVLTPRAVSCTSVSARTGGTEGDNRFRTEMVAIRGEDETIRAFLTHIGVVEDALQGGELDPIDAMGLFLATAGLLREVNEELAGKEVCLDEIPGLGELDPLRVLVEPLLQQLLAVIKDVGPGILAPTQLMKILIAAYEASVLGPLAINQDAADQLEGFFRFGLMIAEIERAKVLKDFAALTDLRIAGLVLGWHNVVTAAELAFQELLFPPGKLP